jgi:hypothetical protein
MATGLLRKLRVAFCLALVRLDHVLGRLVRQESFYPDARDRY